MRKTVAIFGTLLIAAVLIISGSAVAQTMHWIDHVEISGDCTNPGNIVGAADGNDATLGVNGRPNKLGYIIGDLGSGNAMGANQDFQVNASSSYNETYDIFVGNDPALSSMVQVGSGWDTEDLIFTTPPPPDVAWRYILLNGTSGGSVPGDTIWGPEIDAVGWYG